MKTQRFQEEAAERIAAQYLSGQEVALLVMPVGSGKTTIARLALEIIGRHLGELSVAYIFSSGDPSLFNISRLTPSSPQAQISTFTFDRFSAGLESGSIDCNAFNVLIFIESPHDVERLKALTAKTQGFKIIFSATGQKESSLLNLSDSITYKYTTYDAINDGILLSLNIKSSINQVISSLEKAPSAITLTHDLIRAKDESDALHAALELIKCGKISLDELQDISQKKEQLATFEKLLKDDIHFNELTSTKQGPEAVWQSFFQSNPWIFGFGLNYLFNSPLMNSGLEQVVQGFSIKGSGKRIDALLRSGGIIRSLCFVEIKTHKKLLLKDVKTPYRPDVWAISDELAGGISQLQRTVQQSIDNLRTSLRIKNEDGFDSGEKAYLYKPKSVLIIGSLSEFTNSDGQIHEMKFSSFQMFRNSLSDIEIITFDELYERSRALISS